MSTLGDSYGALALEYVAGAAINVTLASASTALVPAGGKLVNMTLNITNIQFSATPLLVYNVTRPQANENRQTTAATNLTDLNTFLGTLIGPTKFLKAYTTTNPTAGSVGLVLQTNTIAQKTIVVPIVIFVSGQPRRD